MGSLPVGSQNHNSLDQDYFQQRFTSDISSDSVLRIRMEVVDGANNVDYGQIRAQFLLMGANDRLTFTDAANGNSITQFEIGANHDWRLFQIGLSSCHLLRL